MPMVRQEFKCKELVDLCRKLGKRPRFPVYMSGELMNAPLEELELSVRSYNCLRRAGMFTIGDVVKGIDGRNDLLRIRHLGMRSADEIMEAIMEYQYLILPEKMKKRYLARVAELNRREERLTSEAE